MENFDIQFAPDNSQSHCIAHVVNLVVQKLLVAFNKAADPDNNDYYVPNKDEPFYYNVDDDPVHYALENEPIPVDNDAVDEAWVDHADAALLGELAEEFADLTPLNKLRLTTKSAHHRRGGKACFVVACSGRQAQVELHGGNDRPCTPARVALDRWVLDHAELQALFLLEKEWTTLEKFGDILKEFTNVTL
ncbi:hypothetical protein DFH08DRAFT_978006 [Mycena albidolilacea]|uniref:Uncharacterized protein n=1 Tax=Mycena albidolilacea TaxID=1033008 RepID=A0AAD6Z052_9AGAR|nr:hypothetical protein DFH08DRAFT_978006 [Mycena albidolilacea]